MEKTFDEWSFSFVESMKVKNASPNTIEVYRYHLRDFLAFLKSEGFNDFRQVGVETLTGYKLHLNEKYPKSFWSICVKVRAVKRFFEYLVQVGRVVVSPAKVLKEPRIKNRIPKAVLSVQEAQRILEQPKLNTGKGIMDRAILETFYSSGIRSCEMQGLGLDDVDFQGGLLTVRLGKGRKDRITLLGAHALKFIEAYLKTVRPTLARRGEPCKALWLNFEGKPLSKQMIAKRVRGYGRKAGLGKKVSPHAWRHSFATGLIRNGADIRHVQELLGHARATNTAVYCRVAAVEMKEVHAYSHPRNEEEFGAMPQIQSLTAGRY